MALKDLLVCVDQTEHSLVRLRLATDLAIRHGSHLTALYPREWSQAQLDWRKSAELGLVSAEGLHKLDERIEASIEAVAERLCSTLDELTRGGDVDAELRSIDGTAAEINSPIRALRRSLHPGRDGPERAGFGQLHASPSTSFS